MPETVRHPRNPSISLRGVLRDRPDRSPRRENYNGMGEAWTALSTIIAGIGVWGAAGYGLDWLFGTKPALFVIGVLVGNFAAIYLIYMRAVRQEEENKRAA